MASIPTLILFGFFLSHSLVYSSSSSDLNPPTGLTIELIPPYSPKSPLFNANIPFLQSLQPPVQRLPFSAMVVEVGIGTLKNGYKKYFLTLDTGSDIIWTQCEGCNQPGGHCYPQKDDPFPNSQSMSYKPLPCRKHPPCSNECEGAYCSYSESYADKTKTCGILATETLTFTSSSPAPARLENIVFGCGTKNYDPTVKDKTNQIAGIFGMGQGDRSFIKQLGQLSGGRFSYCFIGMQVEKPPPMYLRFGSDIKPPKNIQTIDFFERKDHEGPYFVNLIDMGVAGVPLHINPQLIDSGGTVVDSGSSITSLNVGAYKLLADGIDKYFSDLREFEKVVEYGYQCYIRKKGAGQGYNKIPSVTFYFKGAQQLDVFPEATFYREVITGGREQFCLMFDSSPRLNIIGAFQQMNTKFIYNMQTKKLQFGREDCALNG